MPIANCMVTPNCPKCTENLVELWSIESGMPADHMTINLIATEHQWGKPYPIMATLLLPSIWSKPDISALQLGLAKALAQGFHLDLGQVQVITHIIDSGRVVENGTEETW